MTTDYGRQTTDKKNRRRFVAVCGLWSVVFFLTGCYKPLPPVTQLSEAHKKFEQVCREELQIKPVITALPNTLYVYVPVNFDILQTKATAQTMMVKTEPSQKRLINFVKTAFKEETVSVRYDISSVMSYPKSLGYGSTYSEEFSRLHNNLLNALSRSYSDLEKGQKPMDFVILIIVDIRNGIGVKNVFNFTDLQKVMVQALPQDEYVKRYISEIIGDQSLIGNTRGRELKYKDLTWPEFLARQITYRINFKYQRSAFPPTESDVNEIMRVVYNTLSAYNFKDAQTITLDDLASKKTYRFNFSQLATFGQE